MSTGPNQVQKPTRSYEVLGTSGQDLVGPFVTGVDNKGKHLLEYHITCPYTEVAIHHKDGKVEKIKRGKGVINGHLNLGAKLPLFGRKRFIEKQANIYKSPVAGPADISVAPRLRPYGSSTSTSSAASHISAGTPIFDSASTEVGVSPDFRYQRTIHLASVFQPHTVHHQNGETDTFNNAKLLHATLQTEPVTLSTRFRLKRKLRIP